MTFAEALVILAERKAFLLGFPAREFPPRHALFCAAGVYFEVSLDRPDGEIEAMTWYEPEMLNRVAEAILQETVPQDAVRPMSDLPKHVSDEALRIYEGAGRLRAQLDDGRHWIKGRRGIEPFIMKAGVDWLALEMEKGKLSGLRRWDEDDVRAELCQVFMADGDAQSSPVDERLRARVLELAARAQSELARLDDRAMGYELKEDGGLKTIGVRRDDGFARLRVHDGNVYELDWTSAEGVRTDILQALVDRRPGKVIRLDTTFLEQVALKTDRAKYPALMREGRLKVGAVPAQTDSEWTLYHSRGKFRIRYSMDGRSTPISEREALRILGRRGYRFVVFDRPE